MEWEREGSTFVVTPIGRYPAQDLADALDEILAVEDFPCDAGIVLDVRRAESLLDRSWREIADITRNFAASSDAFGRRCALVVEGLLRFGLMRMASAWASAHGVEARIFRDEGKARDWVRAAAVGSRRTQGS